MVPSINKEPNTRTDKESHRHTMRIHGQMYLGVAPPFVRPIAWFPPRAPAASGCTLTWLASIIHQGFQNLFSDSLVTPPAKPAAYILPVSIRFWQVPPRCPGTQNPEYTVDKLPGITGIPSSCPLFANRVWSDFLPRSVADIVSMLFLRHISAPPLF